MVEVGKIQQELSCLPYAWYNMYVASHTYIDGKSPKHIQWI